MHESGCAVPFVSACLLSLSLLAAAESPGVTIFAFDDHSVPFKKNLFVTMAQARKFEGNPVVHRGPAGSPDSYRAQFYGSVLKIGGKFRMWYAACSYDPAKGRNRLGQQPGLRRHLAHRLCRIHRRDPLDQAGSGPHPASMATGTTIWWSFRTPSIPASSIPLATFVLYEPDDPNPEHRYKMALYGKFYNSDPTKERHTPGHHLSVVERGRAALETRRPRPESEGLRREGSALHHRACLRNRRLLQIRRDLLCHRPADDAGHYPAERRTGRPHTGHPTGRATSSTGARRAASPSSATAIARGKWAPWKKRTKAPASGTAATCCWAPTACGTEHRSAATCAWTLGLLVSNDGVHFREPVADHPFVKSGRGQDWDRNGVLQGQGFLNVGDQTYIYYGSWDPSLGQIVPGAIGLSTLPRDRFGSLSHPPSPAKHRSVPWC